MPLFRVGNYSDVNMSFAGSAKVVGVAKKTVQFPSTLSIGAVKEASFDVEMPAMDLAKSSDRWGINLKSLSLYKSFEGLIANVFNPTNNIYFTSIAWDYGGGKPFVYPPIGKQPSGFLIPMKSKTTRHFVGDGVNLWPAQVVTGALNLVIIVNESDKNVRDLGDQLSDLHDKVANSKLASLITAISKAPAVAAGVAISEAVNELLSVSGNIMKRNGDDFVDLFEGSYGTDKLQHSGIEKYDHEAAGIEIELTISRDG